MTNLEELKSHNIHSVALFGKRIRVGNGSYVMRLVEVLREVGVQVMMHTHLHETMKAHGLFEELAGVEVFDKIPASTDLVISIGGDGTFLSTASMVGDRALPILGVNTGRLGFLADVTTEGIDTVLRQVLAGEYTLSPRALVEVHVEGGGLATYPFALNEVAVLKHDNSSLIEVETYVNGHLLTNYLADGLIVSTPTGSTGYALSVGGPILAVDSPSFCVAPVAPHSLTMRPVVLSDESVLTLTVKSRSGNFLLAIDGRSQSFAEGTQITLRKAAFVVNVVKVPGSDFFSTLRNKMMWGVDVRG